MPIIDDQLTFFDSTAITGSATSTTSSSVLDLTSGAAKNWKGTAIHPDQAAGGGLALNVVVESTAIAASATAVLQLDVYNHTSSSSISSGTLVSRYYVNSVASGIAVGKYLVKDILPAGQITKRYLGMVATVNTAAISAGKITSWIGKGSEKNDAHGSVSGL